ncbi:unnamed protein product [marine sediment metagenome]|uniref:Cobalamin biosynthesis protein CbiM n=1 Tax=marine sediment metagenome TaxID=412755 RepID=X0Z8R1_9ZZZZ
MHIPDGFLDLKTTITTAVASAGGLGYGVKEIRKKLGDKHIPLLGVTAAFIFAAQMLNFPIAGGTSGHFLGAALAAILLGPWASLIIINFAISHPIITVIRVPISPAIAVAIASLPIPGNA